MTRTRVNRGVPPIFSLMQRLQWKGNIALFAVLVAAILSACSTAHVVVGQVRPATNADSIKTYLNPPKKYDVIALITTDSNASFRFSAQGKVNAAMSRARKDAAKLGANGLLLQDLGESGSVSVGSGTATAYSAGNTVTATGTSLGVSGGGLIKTVRVLAIYVSDE